MTRPTRAALEQRLIAIDERLALTRGAKRVKLMQQRLDVLARLAAKRTIGTAPLERKSDPRHGTPNGYSGHRCRCARCRHAHARQQYVQRQARVKRLRSGQAQVEHGLASTYGNWGCRCKPCRGAWSAAIRERRNRSKEQTQEMES